MREVSGSGQFGCASGVITDLMYELWLLGCPLANRPN